MEKVKPILVILFGSRARGNHKPWSDYDLLVIADFKMDFLDRIPYVRKFFLGFKADVDIHPYTLEEAKCMLRKGHPTIFDALNEGIVLYKDKRADVLLSLFEDLKRKGMRKTEATIIVPK